MKALRHLPEWNPTPGKSEKHAIAKNKKMALLPTPYSSLTTLQVHATGYIPEKGRVDKRFGNGGSETLFVDMGVVHDEAEVARQAEATHSLFITKKPAPMNEV